MSIAAVSSHSGFFPQPPRSGDSASSPEQNQRGSNIARTHSDFAKESELSSAEKAQVSKLKAADRKVRAHEQAHAAAAGGVAHSAPKYTLVRGPDGNSYAVAGEVAIDTSPVPGDPEATAAKAETIRRAALAPAQPSGQDMAVAAAASAMLMQARLEMQLESTEGETGRAKDSAEASVETDSANSANRASDGLAAESESSKAGGACSVCGGQHGSGAHSDALSNILQNTYQPGM